MWPHAWWCHLGLSACVCVCVHMSSLCGRQVLDLQENSLLLQPGGAIAQNRRLLLLSVCRLLTGLTGHTGYFTETEQPLVTWHIQPSPKPFRSFQIIISAQTDTTEHAGTSGAMSRKETSLTGSKQSNHQRGCGGEGEHLQRPGGAPHSWCRRLRKFGMSAEVLRNVYNHGIVQQCHCHGLQTSAEVHQDSTPLSAEHPESSRSARSSWCLPL